MKRIVYAYWLIFTIFSIGCSSPSLVSSWKTDEIIIDGSREEWGDNIHYLEEEKVAISFKNDNDFLYLCLATSERSKILRIMEAGLTVWFDPQNSDGKTVGIQYPIKQQRDPFNDRQFRKSQNESNMEGNFEKMFNGFKETQNEVLIVNEKKFPLFATPINNKEGVEASLGFEIQQYVYELKIPLANNNMSKFYVDALPKENVIVGFESGEFKRSEGEGRMRENPNMGMSGGRRGGIRGGDQKRNRDMQGVMEPINFSVDVKLSSNIKSPN